MNRDQLKEILLAAMQRAGQKQVNPDNIKDEMNLRTDLSIDSLSMIEMVWEVEEKLGIHIDEARLKQIQTVGDVLQTIETLLAEKDSPPKAAAV